MQNFSNRPAGPTAPGIGARIIDPDGVEGYIVTQLDGKAFVRLANGLQVLVSVEATIPAGDDTYRLPFTLASLQTAAAGSDEGTSVIPVIQENINIQKRTVETGSGVRVTKTVHERTEVIDEPLTKEEVVIEHRLIERWLLDADLPSVRYEGETLVIPVIEEVLSVQKQLILREEVRITRRSRQVREPREVRLRSEQVSVERFEDQPRADDGGQQ